MDRKPALLTRMSRRWLNASETVLAASSTLERLATSRWRVRILGSGCPASLAAAWISCAMMLKSVLAPSARPETPARA